VRGNAAQIHQVVMNLVTNASEALGGKQGTITVATDIVHISAGPGNDPFSLQEGGYVRLRVCDTGCGMTAETRARIFDQFFTTKSAGRGLGLAAVHGIVRSHGGAIYVESAPDRGSTFDILLPCMSAATNRTIGAGSGV
jgi:signal transduction histidine kinase